MFSRESRSETSRVSEILRTETVGGARLLAASATAVVWANSPWSAAYDMVGGVQVGADSLGLHLELGGRARKFVGDLSDWVAQVEAGGGVAGRWARGCPRRIRVWG